LFFAGHAIVCGRGGRHGRGVAYIARLERLAEQLDNGQLLAIKHSTQALAIITQQQFSLTPK